MKLFGRSFFERVDDAGRNPSAALTGAMMRSVRVNPNEAKLIRDMTDLSARLARGAADYNDKMFRSFDAGRMDNWTQGFVGTYGNANTEIFTYFYRIWARCRSIAKDMPHGKAILRTYKNNVVGHDPFSLTMRLGKKVKKPHPKTGERVSVFEPDEDRNELIEKEWRKFCQPKNFTIRKTISFMEALNQAISEAITIGSVIIRKWRGYPGNKYGFAVDLLESDRLEPNYQGFDQETGNPIRASIERDPTWDYPVAYHILVRHPGEFVANNYPGRASNRDVLRERVLAEDIIHFNNPRDRAEQDLGFTELEACVQSIYMNFKYAGALTQASLASCCKPWVIEKTTPTGISYTPTPEEYSALISSADAQGLKNLVSQGLMSPDKTQQGNLPPTEAMSPAMTKVLDWGFTMKVLDPKFPIEAAHEFRVDNNKEIAAASGVGYSSMTGDFQSLGYIAAQMSKQPERDTAMALQAHMEAVVVRDIFEEWVRASIMAGVIPGGVDEVEEIVDAARFKGKRWPFTDKLREVQALILQKDARLISPQQAQDEMPDGIKYEDVVAQISEAQQTEEAHGLTPLDFDPTQVVVKDTLADGGSGGDEGDESAQTQKPIMPHGSKTAKGQKTGSVRKRGEIKPQVQAMIRETE